MDFGIFGKPMLKLGDLVKHRWGTFCGHGMVVSITPTEDWQDRATPSILNILIDSGEGYILYPCRDTDVTVINSCNEVGDDSNHKKSNIG
jgi:hypothetical protein